MMLFVAKACLLFLLIFTVAPLVFFGMVFLIGRFFNVVPAADSLINRLKK